MAEKELSVKANFQTTRDKKQMGSNERQKSTVRDPGEKNTKYSMLALGMRLSNLML